MISLVTMATNVDSKLLTIVFLFLSGTDHSVKVSSNSESVRARALLEFFGGYRELMLNSIFYTCFLQKWRQRSAFEDHVKFLFAKTAALVKTARKSHDSNLDFCSLTGFKQLCVTNFMQECNLKYYNLTTVTLWKTPLLEIKTSIHG